jgi:hypothetical protein
MSKLSAEDNGMTVRFLYRQAGRNVANQNYSMRRGQKLSQQTTVNKEVANPGCCTALFRNNLI